MKTLSIALSKLILLGTILFLSQPGLAEPNEVESLIQQRIELLEEALRLARLRYQAGVGTIDDLGWITPELLSLRLKTAQESEFRNIVQAGRIKAFELALADALETEKDAKLLEKAGLGTRSDVLSTEIWRLNIEIQLEEERKNLALEQN